MVNFHDYIVAVATPPKGRLPPASLWNPTELLKNVFLHSSSIFELTFRKHIHVLLHFAGVLPAIAVIDYSFRHFSKQDHASFELGECHPRGVLSGI